MLFINDLIKRELGKIWKEYQSQGFKLFCKGVELLGNSFEDWYTNNKSLCMNPESVITTESGSVVFIRCMMITFNTYDGDLLVTTSNNSSKYSPSPYKVPVIYYSNKHIEQLIEYIKYNTKFDISTSYVG